MRDNRWDATTPASEPRRWPGWATGLLVGVGLLAVFIAVMVSLTHAGREQAWPLLTLVDTRMRSESEARAMFARNPGLQDQYGTIDQFFQSGVIPLKERPPLPVTEPPRTPDRFWVASRATQLVAMHRADRGPWLVVVLDQPGALGRTVPGEGLRLVFQSDKELAFEVLREVSSQLRMAARARALRILKAAATDDGLRALMLQLQTGIPPDPSLESKLRALRPRLAALELPANGALSAWSITRRVSPVREEETVNCPLGDGTRIRVTHRDGRLVQMVIQKQTSADAEEPPEPPLPPTIPPGKP